MGQWLDEQYHTALHSSTKQTPLERYLKQAHLVREAPKNLDDYFRLQVMRKVDKDRTISLRGRLYEAPVHLIGKTATLLYQEDDPTRVEIYYGGVSCGLLVPLDVNINCRVYRENHTVKLKPLPDQRPPDEKYAGGKLFRAREVDDGI